MNYLAWYDAYEERLGFHADYGSYATSSTLYNSGCSIVVEKPVETYFRYDLHKTKSSSRIGPWWTRAKPAKQDILNILKTEQIFDKITSFLSSEDSESFKSAVYDGNFGKIALKCFNNYVIFSNILKYLRDDDKATFHIFVNPKWKPWFYFQKTDWTLLSKTWKFDYTTVKLFSKNIVWSNVDIDNAALWTYRHYVDWKDLCTTRFFSTKSMIRFEKYICFKTLSCHQTFTQAQKNLAKSRNWNIMLNQNYE